MSNPCSLTLTNLIIYPVKSCRGIHLSESMLTPKGLELDREWMVVDPSGTFVTQREEPRMALITTELTSNALVIRGPAQEALVIPLEVRPMALRTVQVWRHALDALDEGPTASQWFSSFLNRPLHLVRFPADHRRLSNREWTGSINAENRFSDAYPILLISEESLADLNRRIGGVPLLMDRFRTNLVVAGGPPYFEDVARVLQAPDIEFRIIKPCTRCNITATNQQTAEVGIEPLKTLATYRRSLRPSGVVFGQNIVTIRGVGSRLRVGMTFQAE